MHVLIVTDQHADSLGGAQVSIRQQQRALIEAGHIATVVAPRMHRAYRQGPNDIDLPSLRLTSDGEYGMSWPGRRVDRLLLRRLGSGGLPSVDVVHVQGDFWGALIGYRIARALHVPVAHTLHNDLDAGTRAVARAAPIAFWGLRVWRRMLLGRALPVATQAKGAWRYLAELIAEAGLVIAPSHHFAERLSEHGVTGAVVAPTGVDDELITRVRATLSNAADARVPGPIRLIWLGRMSAEKRIIETLEAFAASRRAAERAVQLHIYGQGLLQNTVQRRIGELGIGVRVHLHGSVGHLEALQAIAAADALLQTSIGFETQGMTVFEAAALGTPVVFSDPAIASEMRLKPSWLAPGGTVTDLTAAIDAAVSAIAGARERGRPARVEAQRGEQWLQSRLTDEMIGRYRVLTDGGAARRR